VTDWQQSGIGLTLSPALSYFSAVRKMERSWVAARGERFYVAEAMVNRSAGASPPQ